MNRCWSVQNQTAQPGSQCLAYGIRLLKYMQNDNQPLNEKEKEDLRQIAYGLRDVLAIRTRH